MGFSVVRHIIAVNNRSLFAYGVGLSRFPRRPQDGFARTLFPATPQFLHTTGHSAGRKHFSRPHSLSRLTASGKPWVSPAIYRCWSERTCGLARLVSQGAVGFLCHRIQRLCHLAVYSTRVTDPPNQSMKPTEPMFDVGGLMFDVASRTCRGLSLSR